MKPEQNRLVDSCKQELVQPEHQRASQWRVVHQIYQRLPLILPQAVFESQG
jgi:hypothetical protein